MRGADDEPDNATPPGVGTGVPDGRERLWTPHRMAYIKGEGKPTGPRAEDGCPFCRAPEVSDEEGLVVARGKTAYAVLNIYPYTSGHLLVCPYRHVADFTELTTDEMVEIGRLSREAMATLRAVSGPAGFNLGMNQGAVAGAGIAAHLHQHVVPRWGGDANFLPVIAQTKALPQVHADVQARLKKEWNR